MKFIILSTPMPVFNYEGVFTVFSQEENKCNVRFKSIYEVSGEKREEINNIIKNFQLTFLSNLDK